MNPFSKHSDLGRREGDLLLFRALAVGVLLFRLVVFGCDMFVLEYRFSRFLFLPPDMLHWLYLVSLVFAVLSIIWPAQLYFYAIVEWLWGLLNIAGGGGIGSMLLYLLGCFCAYKMGFFRRATIAKIALLLGLLIAVSLSRFRFGFQEVISIIVEALLLLYVLSLMALFSRKELYIIRRVGREKTVLPDPATIFLSPQQAAMLTAVMADEKYAVIAERNGMSVSTFKRKIKELFSVLNVEDKTEFLKRYRGRDFFSFGSPTDTPTPDASAADVPASDASS